MKTPIKDIIANNLSIDHLSEKEQNEIILELTDIIFQRVILEYLERIDEKDVEELEKLTKESNGEKLKTFLEEKIPGYEEIRDEAVAEEIQIFKDSMNELKNLVDTSNKED